MDLFKETQKIDSGSMGEEGTAFSLKIVGEKAIVKQAKKDNIEEIFVSWKKKELEIGRVMFQNFPQEILAFVSKTHCRIVARKELVSINNDNSDQKSSSNISSGPLSKQDSRSKKRSNSRNKREEKMKKNPRIKVNGEVIIESDIEEKKESS